MIVKNELTIKEVMIMNTLLHKYIERQYMKKIDKERAMDLTIGLIFFIVLFVGLYIQIFFVRG